MTQDGSSLEGACSILMSSTFSIFVMICASYQVHFLYTCHASMLVILSKLGNSKVQPSNIASSRSWDEHVVLHVVYIHLLLCVDVFPCSSVFLPCLCTSIADCPS